jgi:predicted neuraminidase
VGGVLLGGGPLVLAFNNAEQNREDLSLAVSNDFGASWRVARHLEGESLLPRAPVLEYSYPWIMQDRSGDVHVLYTWGRSRIKHVVFNRAWLEGG